MTTERTGPHLSAEEIQALLEGELPRGEVAHVRNHADRCSRCASEVRAWQALMEELDELPLLAPSGRFSERVLQQAPVRHSLLSQAIQGLRRWLPGRGGTRHPAPSVLQDYVDGILGNRRARWLAGHLEACPRCRSELEAWESVVTGLEGLPRFGPSAAFADRVLARVRIRPVTARKSLGSRALELLDRLVPSTPRGWGVAGGVAAVPVAALAGVTAYLTTHPLVNLVDLQAFAWWRVADLWSRGTAWVGGTAADYALESPLGTLVQTALQAPGWTAGAAVVVWFASAAASWVLYRNLIAHSDTAGRHVQA